MSEFERRMISWFTNLTLYEKRLVYQTYQIGVTATDLLKLESELETPTKTLLEQCKEINTNARLGPDKEEDQNEET